MVLLIGLYLLDEMLQPAAVPFEQHDHVGDRAKLTVVRVSRLPQVHRFQFILDVFAAVTATAN